MRFRLAWTFVAAAAAAVAPAASSIIYFCDDVGNVGSYDDVTGIAAPVGDLSAFEVGQVIGLAWDPATQRILLLDRDAPQVYAMDPGTGTAAPLFDPGFVFQGGAVSSGALYGMDESGQTVEAFTLGTNSDLGLSAASIVGHHHGVGVDPATGQVYVGGSLQEGRRAGRSSDGTELPQGEGAQEIATVGADGSYGVQIVTFDTNVEDIDYYRGNFLLADFSTELRLVDAASGNVSVFLDAAQVSAGGITGSTSGVVVRTERIPTLVQIPTLGPWGLGALAAGLAVAALLLVGRRRNRASGQPA